MEICELLTVTRLAYRDVLGPHSFSHRVRYKTGIVALMVAPNRLDGSRLEDSQLRQLVVPLATDQVYTGTLRQGYPGRGFGIGTFDWVR